MFQITKFTLSDGIYPIEYTYIRIEDILWPRQIVRMVKVRAIWWGKQPCSLQTTCEHDTLDCVIQSPRHPEYTWSMWLRNSNTRNMTGSRSGGVGYVIAIHARWSKETLTRQRGSSCWSVKAVTSCDPRNHNTTGYVEEPYEMSMLLGAGP